MQPAPPWTQQMFMFPRMMWMKMYEGTVSGNVMYEERCRSPISAEYKEGKRQNALKRVADLKPSLASEENHLPSAGRKP